MLLLGLSIVSYGIYWEIKLYPPFLIYSNKLYELGELIIYSTIISLFL